MNIYYNINYEAELWVCTVTQHRSWFSQRQNLGICDVPHLFTDSHLSCTRLSLNVARRRAVVVVVVIVVAVVLFALCIICTLMLAYLPACLPYWRGSLLNVTRWALFSPATCRCPLCRCRAAVAMAGHVSAMFSRYTTVSRTWSFLSRDALHSADNAVARCPSVRPSHAGIVSTWLNMSLDMIMSNKYVTWHFFTIGSPHHSRFSTPNGMAILWRGPR